MLRSRWLAADADRDEAIAALREAYAVGRLTTSELELRAAAVVRARSRVQIARSLRHLPGDGRAYAQVAIAVTSAAAGLSLAVVRWTLHRVVLPVALAVLRLAAMGARQAAAHMRQRRLAARSRT
jgi:hypothetical protein